MFQKFNKAATISLSVAIVSVVVGLGVNAVFAAWTAPSDVPPLGDIAAPINISNSDQYKVGGLRLGSANSPGAYQLYVEGDTFFEGNLIPGTGDDYTIGSQAAANPWNELWIDTDPDGGILENGIHFTEPTIGIRYDALNNQFDFYKDSVVSSIGSNGDFSTTGSIIAAGDMNIDSNTLVVDSSNNRVGIGNSTPDYALHLKAGDIVIEDGRLMVGGASFPNADSTFYVGYSGSPVSTIRAIEAYSNGTESTIYGYNSGSSWRAGVQGHGTGTYGVRGSTDSGSRAGVFGFNTSYSTGTYNATGVKGKNTITFGSGTYGTDVNHAKGTGVEGEGPSTNRSRGYIDSFGVIAKAGTASADSPTESITSYGLYAIEGVEEFGGVSYAGYFEGDVHIAGNLTVEFGDRIGLGTSSPVYTLDVETGTQEGLRLRRNAGSTYLDLQGYDIGTRLRDDSGNLLWTLGKDNTDNYFKIESGSGELGTSNTLVISDSGNISVGTANVTDKLRVKGNLRVDSEDANPAYLQIDSITTAPDDADCDAGSERGRMVLDTQNDLLYVCDDSGWLSTAL